MYIPVLYGSIGLPELKRKRQFTGGLASTLVALFSKRKSILMREETGAAKKNPRFRLRSPGTQPTYNEIGNVIDDHYACLTHQGEWHGDIILDKHSFSYQRRPTSLNFGEQTGTRGSLW